MLFSNQDIKDAQFCMPTAKSPSLNGDNSGFYKATWDVMGPILLAIVKECLREGVIPKGWHATSAVILPKVANLVQFLKVLLYFIFFNSTYFILLNQI